MQRKETPFERRKKERKRRGEVRNQELLGKKTVVSGRGDVPFGTQLRSKVINTLYKTKDRPPTLKRITGKKRKESRKNTVRYPRGATAKA